MIQDPYKVLGVTRDASDDAIKQAYRELARKYHPDNYTNNPLSDLAQEKMKEINQAYDIIVKERAGHAPSGGQYAGTANYAGIRRLIEMGNIIEAERQLSAITDRGAEWYYLYGTVLYRKGWFDAARQNIEKACEMAPSNLEYRNALNRMANMNMGYRTYGQNTGMSGCDVCSGLICADCCCECMGGDLIACC